MKLARFIFCLSIFLFLDGLVLKAAVNSGALIKEAEQAYTSGQYEDAIELWTQLYAHHYTDPQLLINIGNAQALLGNNAEAMMAYEKAFRFRPSDKELKIAINDLRAQNENSVERAKPFFISRWANIFLALFRPYVWAFAGLLVLIIGLINWLSSMDLIKGKWRFIKGRFQLYGIMGVLLLAISFLSYRNIYRLDEAIVFTKCDVHQGPSGQSPLVRPLDEGEKVKCKDHITGWTKVQLLNLEEGWIKDECIHTINVKDHK